MRGVIRIFALSLALLSLFIWTVRGANRGWTKTSIYHEKQDPVTGLQYRTVEERFVPGVDLLAGALVAATTLFAGSLIRFKPKPKPHNS